MVMWRVGFAGWNRGRFGQQCYQTANFTAYGENSTRRFIPASPRPHGCTTENVSDPQVISYLVAGLQASQCRVHW